MLINTEFLGLGTLFLHQREGHRIVAMTGSEIRSRRKKENVVLYFFIFYFSKQV